MANTKKRRKRVKRQLKKRTKQQAAEHVFSFRDVEDLKKDYQTKEYKDRMDALEKKAEVYQVQLDRIYGEGNVKPLTRYVNNKSSLQHYCMKCNGTFWTRPLYQLKYESMRHVCGGNSKLFRLNEITVRNVTVKKVITEEDKREMLKLYNEGISYRQIASQFNISHATVSKYVRLLK